MPKHDKKADDFQMAWCSQRVLGYAIGSMTCSQERQRQGIQGVHMRSLDEHLDQQELQKLLGEVIHHTRDSVDAPAPDYKTLAKVILSRQVLYCLEEEPAFKAVCKS